MPLVLAMVTPPNFYEAPDLIKLDVGRNGYEITPRGSSDSFMATLTDHAEFVEAQFDMLWRGRTVVDASDHKQVASA